MKHRRIILIAKNQFMLLSDGWEDLVENQDNALDYPGTAIATPRHIRTVKRGVA
jgi:hypothetical protein